MFLEIRALMRFSTHAWFSIIFYINMFEGTKFKVFEKLFCLFTLEVKCVQITVATVAKLNCFSGGSTFYLTAF